MRLKAALGLRGAPPLNLLPDIQAVLDLAGLEDVAYADQPLFWWTSGDFPALAANFSYIGVRAATPRVTCDGAILGNPDVASQLVQVLASNQSTALASDTVIWAGNRTSTAPVNPPSPASRRVAQQSVTAFGQGLAQARLPPGSSLVVPVKWRLALGGEVLCRSVLGVGLTATLFGREFQD